MGPRIVLLAGLLLCGAVMLPKIAAAQAPWIADSATSSVDSVRIATTANVTIHLDRTVALVGGGTTNGRVYFHSTYYVTFANFADGANSISLSNHTFVMNADMGAGFLQITRVWINTDKSNDSVEESDETWDASASSAIDVTYPNTTGSKVPKDLKRPAPTDLRCLDTLKEYYGANRKASVHVDFSEPVKIRSGDAAILGFQVGSADAGQSEPLQGPQTEQGTLVFSYTPPSLLADQNTDRVKIHLLSRLNNTAGVVDLFGNSASDQAMVSDVGPAAHLRIDNSKPILTAADTRSNAQPYFGHHRSATLHLSFDSPMYVASGSTARCTIREGGQTDASEGISNPAGTDLATAVYTPMTAMRDTSRVSITEVSATGGAGLVDRADNPVVVANGSVEIGHLAIDNTAPNLTAADTRQDARPYFGHYRSATLHLSFDSPVHLASGSAPRCRITKGDQSDSSEVISNPDSTDSATAAYAPSASMPEGNQVSITEVSEAGGAGLVDRADNPVEVAAGSVPISNFTIDNTPPKLTAAATGSSSNPYFGEHRGATLTLSFDSPVYLTSGSAARCQMGNGDRSDSSDAVSDPAGAQTATAFYRPSAAPTALPEGSNRVTIRDVSETGGGGLVDRAENPVVVAAGSVQISNLTIDNTAPKLTGADTQSSGNPYFGQKRTATLHLTFNETMHLKEGGAAKCLVTKGGKTNETGEIVDASGTQAWTCGYTPVPPMPDGGDVGITEVTAKSAVDLVDRADNPVVVENGSIPVSNLSIDNTAPKLTAADTQSSDNPYFGQKRPATLHLTFNDTMHLKVGRVAKFVVMKDSQTSETGSITDSSGAQAWTCEFTPAPPMPDGSGVRITDVAAKSAEDLVDRAENPVVIEDGSVQVDNLTIDNTVPRLTGADTQSSVNPYFGLSRPATLHLTFSDTMHLSGGAATCELTKDGVPNETGEIVDASGTQAWTCGYTPVPPMPDGDEVKITALRGTGGAKLLDRADNEVVLEGPVSIGSLTIDNTAPRINDIRVFDPDWNSLCDSPVSVGGKPLGREFLFDFEATDDGSGVVAATGSGTVITPAGISVPWWETGLTNAGNVWALRPYEDQLYQLQVKVKDGAENQAIKQCPFQVDNARVLAAGTDVYAERPGTGASTMSLPAGYPVTIVACFRNDGTPAIQGSHADLTLTRNDVSLAEMTIPGYPELPANASDCTPMKGTLTVPAQTDTTGSVVLAVSSRFPGGDLWNETKLQPMQIKSSNLDLSLVLPDTVQAGLRYAFDWTVRQHDNGGVASDVRVRGWNGGAGPTMPHATGSDPEWQSGSGIPAVLFPNASFSPSAGYPGYLVPLTEADGTPLVVTKEMIEARTAQTGDLWAGPAPDRLSVYPNSRWSACDRDTVRVVNAVVSAVMNLDTGSLIDKETVMVPTDIGSLRVYCHLKNTRPWISVSATRVTATVPADGRFQLDENSDVWGPSTASKNGYQVWETKQLFSFSSAKELSVRFQGSTQPDVTDRISFAASLDRMASPVSDTITVGYLDQAVEAKVCRVYPQGEDLGSAGDTLLYRVAITTDGPGQVYLYVDKSAAAAQHLAPLAGNDNAMSWRWDGRRRPFIQDPNDPNRLRSTPITVTNNSPTVWIQARANTDTEDGADGGLTASDILVSFAAGSDPGTVFGSVGDLSCVPPLAKLVNVKVVLEASLVDDPSALEAGGSATVRLKLTNVGHKDLPAGVSNIFTILGNPFVSDFGATGLPDFSAFRDGLTKEGGSLQQDWPITVSSKIQASSGRQLRDLLFVKPYANLQIGYPPFYPVVGTLRDVDFRGETRPVDVHSPEFVATIVHNARRRAADGSWVVSTRGEFVAWFIARNEGTLRGTCTWKFPTGSLPEGLTYGAAGSDTWPPDPPEVAVNPGTPDTTELKFYVGADSGASVVFAQQPDVMSAFRYRKDAEFLLPDLHVIESELSVTGKRVPETADVRAEWEVEYTIRNNSGRNLTPTLYLERPEIIGSVAPPNSIHLQPDGIAYQVEGSGTLRKASAFSADAGMALDFAEALEAVPAGRSAVVTVHLRADGTIPNGTHVDPRELVVKWAGQSTRGGDGGTCEIRNCAMSPRTVQVNPTLVSAGERVTYKFFVQNTGPLPRPDTLFLKINKPDELVWGFGSSHRFQFPIPGPAHPDSDYVVVTFTTEPAVTDSSLVTKSGFRPTLEFAGSLTDPPPMDSLFAEQQIPSVRVRNVHFSLKDVFLAANLVAGGSAECRMTLGNTSPIIARGVTVGLTVTGLPSGPGTLTQSINRLEPGASTPLTFKVPVPVALPDRSVIGFQNLVVSTENQGSDPPVDQRERLEPGRVSTTVKNLDLYYRVKRLTADGRVDPDSTRPIPVGAAVSFRVDLVNQGLAPQEGVLTLAMRVPAGTRLDPATGANHPPTGWSQADDESVVKLNYTTPTDWSNQGQVLKIDGLEPRFRLVTDGIQLDAAEGDTFFVRDRKATGHFRSNGVQEKSFEMPKGDDPAQFLVENCKVNSLSFRLAPAAGGNQIVSYRGRREDLELTIGFGDVSYRLQGDLNIRLTCRDGYRFVWAGIKDTLGSPADTNLAWDETSVVGTSRALRWAVKHDVWQLGITPVATNPGEVADTLTQVVSLSADWELDDLDTPVYCGMSNGLNTDTGVTRLPRATSSATIKVEGQDGQLGRFFARPNPGPGGSSLAGRIGICYMLEKGVTSLRLTVADLAGNVLLAARSGESGGLPLDAGLQCWHWDVIRDAVPNGTYLCKLEVKGTDSRSGSLNEVRRMKLAVLR